jgi:ectoine hydroxylase
MKILDFYPSRIHSEPRLIERADPIVYNQNIQQNTISKEQLESYESNGYLFLENFFDADEMLDLQNELNLIWSQSGKKQNPEIIREPASQEVRSIFAIHRDNLKMKQLSQNEKILDIVTQILGSEVYVHQSRINFKRGFTGKEFYWHSDFETWHVEDGMMRMRALSCSIALEDNYDFNGPLMVVPGSHRLFLSCVGETPDDHYKQSLRKQEYGIPDQENLTRLVEQGGIAAPTGKAGSIIFFDCNLMHGSNSNITPFSRSNVFIVYNSIHNKLIEPFSGKQPRPEFVATRNI